MASTRGTVELHKVWARSRHCLPSVPDTIPPNTDGPALAGSPPALHSVQFHGDVLTQDQIQSCSCEHDFPLCWFSLPERFNLDDSCLFSPITFTQAVFANSAKLTLHRNTHTVRRHNTKTRGDGHKHGQCFKTALCVTSSTSNCPDTEHQNLSQLPTFSLFFVSFQVLLIST